MISATLSRLLQEQFSESAVNAALVALGYQLADRRETRTKNVRVTYKHAKQLREFPSASLLVKALEIQVELFAFTVLEPPPTDTPAYRRLLQKSAAAFKQELLELTALLGPPSTLRRLGEVRVEGAEGADSFEFAVWQVGSKKLTLEHTQWDDTSPLAVEVVMSGVSELELLHIEGRLPPA